MNKLLITIIAIVGCCVFLYIIAPFSIVTAGYRGVMTSFGYPKLEVYTEGIHFVWPLAQHMNLVDVSIRNTTIDDEGASKDLQTVHIKALLNYHINPENVVSVYRDLGNAAQERIIIPSVQEALKAVTAKFTAEELIAKRTEVRNSIIATLEERLNRHGIKIDEFSIINFNFSKSFNEAIEAKTTAEQLKLKAERDLQRITIEAQQKLTQARAEAEGLAAQRQQVTPELIQLRGMENQRHAIEKWDGVLPTITGGAMPFINLELPAKK
jgi:prohibitin 2